MVRSRRAFFFRFVLFLAIFASNCRVHAKPPIWGSNNPFQDWTKSDGDDKSGKKWSSMLSVDPSKIVSMMIKHGGLLLPDSSKKDLDVLAKVCHAEDVKLNVVERKLEITNFSVRLPEEEDALRIGRVYLRWDSYLRPCVEIEVDDVYVLVEFMNVLLSKNNW